MSKEGVVAFDVGGTTVDAGFVSVEGELVNSPIRIDSPSRRSADEILHSFSDLGNRVKQISINANYEPTVVSIAMPGPFDYKKGVSSMEHKFHSLDGIDIKTPLQEQLSLPVKFINDADAFALGVSWKEYPEENRLVAITLGTGTGSGFVVDGQLVHEGMGVPVGGEIYPLPVHGVVFEKYVSHMAFAQNFEKVSGQKLSVKEIAELAKSENRYAQEHFSNYGERLGEALGIVLAEFKPSRVVFGGGIASSFSFFGPKAQEKFFKTCGLSTPFSATSHEYLALYGAARFVL